MKQNILNFLRNNPKSTIKQIADGIGERIMKTANVVYDLNYEGKLIKFESLAASKHTYSLKLH